MGAQSRRLIFFFENMCCMYFIKRGIRVLQQKPMTVIHRLPSQNKAKPKQVTQQETKKRLLNYWPEASNPPSALKPAATQSAASSRIACRRTAGCRDDLSKVLALRFFQRFYLTTKKREQEIDENIIYDFLEVELNPPLYLEF